MKLLYALTDKFSHTNARGHVLFSVGSHQYCQCVSGMFLFIYVAECAFSWESLLYLEFQFG